MAAGQAHRYRPDSSLEALIALGDGRRLKDRWQLGGLAFLVQALPFGLVLAWILIRAFHAVLGLIVG